MIAGLLSAFMAFGTPSLAQERTQLLAGIVSFRDPALARSLENRLVSLVERKNAAGLRALGDEIRRKDGAVLDAIEALTTKHRATGTVADVELARVALSMGPCHQANLLIRKIVLAIAAGEAKHSHRSGAVRLDDSQADSLYAELILRCERLARLPAGTPKLGVPCALSAGACDEGED